MAIGSTLTKSVRRTWENNKPKLQYPSSDSSKTNSSFRKGSNQGESDSEATSFSSSVHGSTSSGTSSTSRYSSGVERGSHQKKTLDKLNSPKVVASGSIRPSRRRPQSRLTSLPDDGSSTAHQSFPVEPSDASPDLQKPVPKFTRSGSLRSLKILRKKNTPSSESKKSLSVNESHSNKATFSSTLKDSKFPKQVDPQVGTKESEEALSVAKVCSYEHCSLHGHHHHHHEPTLKRFSFLKRRSSKDQKNINPQIQPTDKRPVKKKEDKINKKVSNERGKQKDVDCSIEFYAKTRPEPSFEPNSGDDLHLADIMFGVNGNNNETQMSMWRLIHRHMVSGNIEQELQEEKQSSLKMLAIKNIVREAIEKIILPEDDDSEKNQKGDQTVPDQADSDQFSAKNDKPKGWSYVKKVVLMRRFITELEKAKKKFGPDKRGHVLLGPEPEPEPEAEIVSLRSQTTGEKKDSNEWMLDYALQQVVAELAPTQKRKVALLVKSFEMISPKGVAI